MKIMDLDLESVEVESGSAASSFDSLPKGKYRVMISRADYKQTARGDGHRIPLEMTIIGGDYNGRLLFEGLNVDNPNPTAQTIGKQRLAEILDSVGIDRSEFNDTDQLEGHILIAHVTQTLIKDPVEREKYGDSNGKQNNVSRFSPAADTAPAPVMANGPAPEEINHPQDMADTEAPF